VYLVLFLAGALGGALNAVAGGGSFITLPTLLFAGITPVTANATSTFALWPGSVSAAVAYRHDIGMKRSLLGTLIAVSLVGGLLGGLLLVRTSDTSFMRLLPWLMLLAAATFTFGNQLTAAIGSWLGTSRERPDSSAARPAVSPHAVAGGFSRPTTDAHSFAPWAVVLQFAIAIYGGYFGGGMGIMMLATFAVSGMTDIHEMNGVKSVLGAALNGIALVAFILKGAITWLPGVAMMAGGIVGGYFGAALARRVDRKYIRALVIAIGWGMTTYFFLK
jgi:uncharacterized membrane protein YfcA